VQLRSTQSGSPSAAATETGAGSAGEIGPESPAATERRDILGAVFDLKKKFRTRRIFMEKRLVAVLVLAGSFLMAAPQVKAQAPAAQQPMASSQSSQGISDQDIALMRADIRSQKKQLIAQNLKLSDAQATKFWPIYDQYTAELAKVIDEKYALIKQYASTWGTMTDEQAAGYIARLLQVDVRVGQLRVKYLPIVQQALPGKLTATFFQMDRRLSEMIDLQLASQIPLAQSQGQ
jgi:Spy/CpxP family protein refolding chaperone